MNAPLLTVYTYANCDTCRRAVKWLRAHDVAFREKAIRETPPSEPELQRMLTALGGERRRLLNTSGRDYREQKLGERLPELSDEELFKLLARNGNLVKRPFALGEGVALTGFSEEAWAAALQR
jgi:arsenate reductase